MFEITIEIVIFEEHQSPSIEFELSVIRGM